ncbi:MAG: DUF1003 domain-containing protein [Alphaproteobacteria bacterium]|nr:DUF1003 domain-containing protein [Alphaproteobacteria bacterium]
MAEQTIKCGVCRQLRPDSEIMPVLMLRPEIDALARREAPYLSVNDPICGTCVNRLRTDFVTKQVERDHGEMNALEREVIESIHRKENVADNLNKEFETNLTTGDRIADKVAEFGGSWTFIIIFFALMAVWIAVNSATLIWRPFDPYPFILFNLVLSTLAAIQAPIIMMSQNRQEARDRLRAENDYQVNLKAEIEVRVLSERMDQLLHHQWARLLEIQKLQTEMLQDLANHNKKA